MEKGRENYLKTVIYQRNRREKNKGSKCQEEEEFRANRSKQKYDRDYDETFAPELNMATVLTVKALATSNPG